MSRRLAAHLDPLGVGLAIVAGLYRLALAATPLNDDFLHITLGRQILGGDWPLRDFFDSGVTLMYALSALSQFAFGHRLLAEGVVVALAFAVSAYLVFTLTWRLTNSRGAAVLAAILILLAGPRGYSYPKVLIYAVASALWWRYLIVGRRSTLVWLGVWTAAAFYWRPDHGALVAIGTVLAVVAVDGISAKALRRAWPAGTAAVVLLIPLLALVAGTVGLRSYFRSGFTFVEAQHVEMDTHAVPTWPVRALSDVIALAPREEFAPVVELRWSPDSSPADRAAAIARHVLTPVEPEKDLSQTVRMSRTSTSAVRDLVNDAVVADTAGIDRSGSSLPWSTWPVWQRWRFSQPWLRIHVLPGLDPRSQAAEATATLIYALPLVVLLASPFLAGLLADNVTPGRLALFALFGAVVDVGLLRTPYDVRAVDGIVLPSVLFGCCVAGLWRAVRTGTTLRRLGVRCGVMALALLTLKSVAVAGDFGERANWLAGEWRSMTRARGTWHDVRTRLLARPPLTYWGETELPLTMQLARYAEACVPPSERLAVMWFAPEIYFYSDRLMAVRHLLFLQAWASLADEQHRAVEKLSRFAPPIVLATTSFDMAVRPVYPALVDYIRREYTVTGTLGGDDEGYLIFTRRSRAPVGAFRDTGWLCYR